MEIILICIIVFIVSFLITVHYKNRYKLSKKVYKKVSTWETQYIPINEDLLIIQQKAEDDKHYRNYEICVFERDISQIKNSYLKTKDFIRNHKTKIKTLSPKEKEEKNIFEKYEKYCLKCDKLHLQDYMLNYEEFSIMEANSFFTKHLEIFMTKPIGCYMIYHDKTARYLNGDVNKLMAEEFKNKNY
jgi:superfamily I DNA/RNA helicase